MMAWRRFRAKVERAARGEYESLVPEQFPPLQVYLGGGRPTQLLYFTKDFLCSHWMIEGQFPSHWVALARRGLPTPSYLEEVRRYQMGVGVPISFVGELDPLDLTVYLMLLRGNVDLRSSGRGIPVRYLGVSDDWLRLREKGANPISGTLGMERLEHEHFELIRQALPDLRSLVGERCFALLEAGHKLELEGVCDPSSSGQTFPRRLRDDLNRRMSRPAQRAAKRTRRSPAGRR
jgi:hypothetical protein